MKIVSHPACHLLKIAFILSLLFQWAQSIFQRQFDEISTWNFQHFFSTCDFFDKKLKFRRRFDVEISTSIWLTIWLTISFDAIQIGACFCTKIESLTIHHSDFMHSYTWMAAITGNTPKRMQTWREVWTAFNHTCPIQINNRMRTIEYDTNKILIYKAAPSHPIGSSMVQMVLVQMAPVMAGWILTTTWVVGFVYKLLFPKTEGFTKDPFLIVLTKGPDFSLTERSFLFIYLSPKDSLVLPVHPRHFHTWVASSSGKLIIPSQLSLCYLLKIALILSVLSTADNINSQCAIYWRQH